MILGSSSQAGSAEEPQADIAEGALAYFVRPDQSILIVQDLESALRYAKKKAKKKNGRVSTGQVKAVGVGLEDFVVWLDPHASDLAEEREEDISSLAVGFTARMPKRAVRSQGETTLGSEASGRKRPKQIFLK